VTVRKSLFGAVFILACLGSDCSARQLKPASPDSDSRAESAQDTNIEQLLLAELNRLRSEPDSFIPVLREYRSHFKGKKVFRPGEITLVTNEGVSAVDDAIDFLKSAEPLPALRLSAGMSKAAAVHVEDLGPKGKYGHYGTDGSSPSDRLKRYGQLKVGSAENLGFGERDGRRMVLMLLIDDGVPGRGHRKNMFNPKYKVVGIGCGSHVTYGYMCVIDFAGDFVETSGKQP
jgi:uncharacterized protein YkwD